MKNCMFLFFLVSNIYVYSQEWNILEIGQCPTVGAYDLVVADGQNDGVQRIYVTTKDGGVYEWTFGNGNWAMSHTVHPGPLNNLMHIAAGEARNDGMARIYFAEWNQSARIFEATWNGSTWQTSIVGTAPDINTGVVVGDGRNDGKNRLYVSGGYGLHEWDWDGNSWQNMAINNSYHEVSGDIGNARNDGVNRVVMNTNCLLELSWTGNGFAQNDLLCTTTDTWPDAVQIADGRNDGIQRVYVNTTDGPQDMEAGRWEYTWNGAGWDSQIIETDDHRGDIHLAKLKSDGNNRVYTTTSNYWAGPADDLFEYEWNGTDWVKTGSVLDAISGATAMLASGIGRNDDTLRLYTPNYATGGIYEITHINPYVQEPTAAGGIFVKRNMTVEIFPNPWHGRQLQINISAPENMQEINLELFNHTGKLVWQMNKTIFEKNTTLNIDCPHCQSGFYFLKMQEKKYGGHIEKIIRF